jgi:hypothetical protein
MLAWAGTALSRGRQPSERTTTNARLPCPSTRDPTCDPSAVCGAPVDVAGLQGKHVLGRGGGIHLQASIDKATKGGNRNEERCINSGIALHILPLSHSALGWPCSAPLPSWRQLCSSP